MSLPRDLPFGTVIRRSIEKDSRLAMVIGPRWNTTNGVEGLYEEGYVIWPLTTNGVEGLYGFKDGEWPGQMPENLSEMWDVLK